MIMVVKAIRKAWYILGNLIAHKLTLLITNNVNVDCPYDITFLESYSVA